MQTKLTLKSILPYIIIGILIVILSFIMKDCEHKPNYVLTPNDSINTAIAEKEQIIEYLKLDGARKNEIIDSLKSIKPKYIKGRDRIKDSLIFVSDSSCQEALVVLYNECGRVDSVNNAIISNQEKHIMNDSQIIGNLTEIVYLQKLQHIKDSIRNKQLTDTIPTVKRKGFLKGFGIGFGSGAAASKVTDVLINLNR